MSVYYNEFDPFAAAWLRELIKAGSIPAGDVDERDIKQVTADDLRGYTQCHFFAGIGGWAEALQLAGWPADRPVWTGSCPCQPFSTAGKQKGKADERHLWPAWFRLIRECKPSTIFGEQVAGAITHGWWDDVANDLEAEDYTTGSAVLPACSVGAPHKRDRLWFVAQSPRNNDRGNTRELPETNEWEEKERPRAECNTEFGRSSTLGDTEHDGSYGASECGGHEKTDGARQSERQDGTLQSQGASAAYDVPGNVGDAISAGLERLSRDEQDGKGWAQSYGSVTASDPFSDFEWIECPDGKARPIKPGIRLLADGIPNRVGKLRGYGNAIVPVVAAEFIRASTI